MLDTVSPPPAPPPITGGESMIGTPPPILNEAGFGNVPNFGPTPPPVCPIEPPIIESTTGAAPAIEVGSVTAATDVGVIAAETEAGVASVAGAEVGAAGAVGAEAAASSVVAFDCLACVGEVFSICMAA